VIKMKARKGLDLKHLTIIDATEVPAKPKRYTPYREMLKRIRKGKALVISDEELNVDTVRAGIKRLQRKGEFKQLIITQRKREDGVRVLYIVNPSEELPDTKD
jgi:hypothetical protein